MKRFLLLSALALVLSGLPGLAPAQDSGIPDTFYVEIYPADQELVGNSPFFVRFPIYVTHDVVDPSMDSIAGIIAPLCYSHSNVSHYCSLSYWWNTTSIIDVQPDVQQNRSIFRHLPSMQDPQVRNRMLDMNADNVSGWDFIALDLGDQNSNFFLYLVPTGSPDQRWWEGSRVLLLTMTFRLQDTTTIRIDTCFWPPSDTRILFSNSVAQTYTPVNFMPVTESVWMSQRGDANGDGVITIADVLHMLNYLFKQGPPPVSFEAGDANCDGDLGFLDAIYLLNYLYKGGPPPSCP